MALANETYSLLLAFAALVAGLIAAMIYRRRHSTPSGPALLTFMLALTWWDFTYALHWSTIARPFATFWLDTTFLGVVVAPTAFFAFALQYTRQRWQLSRRRLTLLAVGPAVILILLWTDPWHGLFFSQPRDITSATILNGGPGFWVTVVYLYSLNLAAVLMLLRAFRGAPPLYRGQARVVLLGGLLPWISNFVSIAGLNPLPAIDLTPLAFTLTGAALAYGLLFYRLLDIVPIARDLLIEHMIDGVMVMDARGRVVDINRAAHRMLCITGSSPVGKPAADVLADCPEMLAFTATGAAQGTSQITRGEPPQVLDIRVTVLPSHSRQPTGYLVVIRDVTERMRAEAEIRAANQHLRVQLAEIERLQHELREQATHDSLTGLFNRRFFEETLQRELAQAERERHPFALILLDIDFFKSINDAFGHTAGDLMLQAVGQLLQKQTRGGDVACRFGGEEFAIVMPGATAEQAATRANDWRGLVCALLVPFAGQALRATISAGVAEYPTHGTTRDQLLHAADQALYLSKHGGRDMVTISSTGSPIGQCRTPPVPAQTRGTATTV